jgi:hypothetical protein
MENGKTLFIITSGLTINRKPRLARICFNRIRYKDKFPAKAQNTQRSAKQPSEEFDFGFLITDDLTAH